MRARRFLNVMCPCRESEIGTSATLAELLFIIRILFVGVGVGVGMGGDEGVHEGGGGGGR